MSKYEFSYFNRPIGGGSMEFETPKEATDKHNEYKKWCSENGYIDGGKVVRVNTKLKISK